MRSAGLASVLFAMQLAIPSGAVAAADLPAPRPAVAAPTSAAQPQPPASPAAMSAPPVPSEPVPSPSASVSASESGQSPAIVGHAEAGGHIYSAICAYCHHLDETVSDVGAPGLEDAIKEHGAAWIDRWLADPQGFAEADATARALIAANPYGLVMPAFPAMQDAQNRADVIAFLQSLGEANGKGQPDQ